MKRLILLLTIFLALGIVNAQETYRFSTDAPQGLSVTSSTASHVSLHYSIQELGIANVDNGEAKGQEIILKGQFAPNAEGHPNLPVVNRFVAVPQGATVSLRFRENASTTLNDIDLLPAMPARTDLAEGPIQLRWDADVFGRDADFPTENIVLASPTQIRSLDVVLLSVTPFRYNPVRKTLEVIYDIDIDISFEGGNGQFGESRYFNPDWMHILKNLVINNDMLSATDYYDLINAVRDDDEAGCEYLIITPNNDDALAWADTLKAFRTKQGILTKVVTTTECGGNSANNIRNYIQVAYNNWAIPPAAVLLFGAWYNNTGIRPFYHHTIQGDYNVQYYATDYPYCDMNGDSLADVALGRITARNAQEYQTFVEKTIQYESNPITDPAYYDRPIISSGHEMNKWFMIDSQSINGFYRDKLGKHPTDLYMVNSGSVPTNEWSTAFNVEVLMDYFGPNGLNYIPQSIGELHEWKSKTDSIPLYNALNEGSFLTLYRDHSNYNAWWCPTFKSIYMDSLLFGPPTFVLSISCSTSQFTNAGRSIIDAFCVKQNSGAVGGIGALALTHSYFNDVLNWGIYDCIWPNFLPDMGSDTPPEFIRPSYVLSEAKHYFSYYFFLPNWWPGVDVSTMHIFTYTGDTYLNLFTEVPQPLEVTHGIFCPADATEFTVDAEEGAVVCLSRDGEIIGVSRSNGQPCTFALPTLEENERIIVTATKQNHFRYEYEVTVVSDHGPYVAVERDGLLVENEFDVLHNGENAHIGLKLHNYGNGMAENITMRLTCTSPSIEIIEDSYQCQNIAPYQTATFSNVFYFNIAENTRDMTPVTFTIHIDDGNGEKEYDIVQYIAAPMFVIKPDITYKTSGQQSMLQIRREGITDIHVQIANEGHFNSGPANLQIEIMAPFITVTSPSRMFNSLEKGSTTDVVFRVNAHNSPITDGWIKTKIGLGDGIFQTLTNTELPFGGFNESCDPGYFSTHDWQMSDDAPWATTDDDFHNGDYSAKSGVITHNESSSMSITQTTKATEISFFKKVSSEAKYDKLHFYIDDEDMGEWSGYIPWSEETYPVSQGTHTFKWSYIKDYSVDIGSDCAWVDDINIKPVHSPIYSSGGTLRACKNQNVTIDCSYAYNYQNLIWTTLGDGHFESNQVLHPVYIPGTQDKANGGTTLRLRADGGSPSDLQLILTNAISLGDAIIGDDIIDPQVTNVSHYSVANQAGIDYHWQLEPAEAGHIFPYGNDVDIIWDFGHDILEATLTVSTDATCSQPLSKAIQIDLLSVMERPQSCFSLYPNPSDGKVNLVVEQDLKGKSVVEVYNVLGHLMTSSTLQNLSQGQSIDIDLQHYAPGLYIIKLCNDKGCWSQKVSIR